MLSSAEQDAVQTWVSDGGTLIITADISREAVYLAFAAPYGVTSFTNTSNNAATPNGSHQLLGGVSSIAYQDGVYFSLNLTEPLSVLAVTSSTAEPWMLVQEVCGESNGLGRVLIVGDHNLFTDTYIGNADNVRFLQNIIVWAQTPSCIP